MWKVYCDEHLIYDTQLETLKLASAKLNLELNKAGSFSFNIYPSHPYFSKLEKIKSIIRVYKNDSLQFRGRIINDKDGFYNQKQVDCEGELAFLIDSIQRYEAQSTNSSNFFASLIEAHNSQVGEEKQFKVGNISVLVEGITIEEGANYINTWEALNKELIEKYGGYLWVRHEEDGVYIDYLKDFNIISNQTIEFGENLLNFNKITKGQDIATAIIPLGKDGLTIKDINGGLDYIVNEEAIEKYGFICKKVEFSNIEESIELRTRAISYLADAINLVVSLELSAIDLANLNKDINSFRYGTYVPVKSSPHGVNSNFLITKQSIDLLKPSNNKLILGKSYSTFTEKNHVSTTTQKTIQNTIKNFEKSNLTSEDLDEAIREAEEQSSSSISQSADEILLKVSEEYLLKDDANSLIELVNTTITQTNEEVEIRFNEFSKDIEDVISGTDAQFQEISKYIRFIDGNIVLGEENNELTLKIENDKIAFLQSGVEVAYFSNRKLFVLDGEFIESLKLGKFAFLPRSNGNLSFKKVE